MNYQIDHEKKKQLDVLRSKVQSKIDELNKDVIIFIFNKYEIIESIVVGIECQTSSKGYNYNPIIILEEVNYFKLHEPIEEDAEDIYNDINNTFLDLILDEYNTSGDGIFDNITYRREEFIHE